MARAALELGLREVASALGMSTATITRFEKGGDTRVSTLDALTKYYTDQDIEFLEYNGVRLK